MPNALSGVARFALMADGKHQNPVPPAVVPVKSDISRFAARYHELAKIGFGGSPHQGMPLEYRDRVENEIGRLRRGAGIGFGQKVAKSWLVLAIARRYHRTDFGRFAFLPATRARR